MGLKRSEVEYITPSSIRARNGGERRLAPNDELAAAWDCVQISDFRVNLEAVVEWQSDCKDTEGLREKR